MKVLFTQWFLTTLKFGGMPSEAARAILSMPLEADAFERVMMIIGSMNTGGIMDYQLLLTIKSLR